MSVYRLQAMVVREGDELWGAELGRIVDDEIEYEWRAYQRSCGQQTPDRLAASQLPRW
ncbi:hypothetical protein QLQ12_44310 [Actinoplanes sp. NEAU-A12]|uniref:Transposase n=1 Tax=Actinoplanes sandaracinus TaxID=3045177 RepID=A0ABT6X0U7_9ACTN|nr:hypothetical protein [Actinoplanes sandaracinus]MDI6105627.1 hypothetical protein [Actinoplanes sandaracinus]